MTDVTYYHIVNVATIAADMGPALYQSIYTPFPYHDQSYLNNCHIVATELKDPIWHSLEWQIGSFSSEATISYVKLLSLHTKCILVNNIRLRLPDFMIWCWWETYYIFYYRHLDIKGSFPLYKVIHTTICNQDDDIFYCCADIGCADICIMSDHVTE